MSAAVVIKLKVVPGASRDKIAGWLDDSLKVTVATVAEKGKANKAIEKLLARYLGVNPSSVRIISGQTSPRKTVAIEGLSQASVDALLPRKTST